eukprot:scaffold17368_cov136-Isochrysis_galbana.AAC.1
MGVPRVFVCCLCMCVCLPRTRGRVEAEPHASNAGAWLARVSSACFHESARLMTSPGQCIVSVALVRQSEAEHTYISSAPCNVLWWVYCLCNSWCILGLSANQLGAP